jgi:thiol-disulfide isomerase/thioredoxin
MRSTLTFIQIIILALYAQATSAAGSERTMRVLQPSISIPATQFFDGSKQIKLDVFEGYFVIVNFWATWCSPCIMEMPSLDRAAERLVKNNVLVIAISQDEGGPTQVKPFLDRLKLRKIQILYDLDSKSSRDFAIRGLPTTVLLSPNGEILARLEGNAEWDQGPLLEQILKLTATYSKK